ncbi:MAG TPA: hypothetical protein DHW71_12570 [Gammaproteobacteria bacterium]|nr:hypothetical protein [Gammaproteobacteria bacterium]
MRGLREIYTSDDFNDLGNDLLFEFRLQPAGHAYLASGVHGQFAQPSDDIRFRFLYRCPSKLSLQLDEVAFSDGATKTGISQLRTDARPLWHLGESPGKSTRVAIESQINAIATDFPANNTSHVSLTVGISQTAPLAGTNQYFQPAGCIYYKQDANGLPEEGFYYNYVSDDTWQYEGFGCDTEGSDTHDKKFSLEQFTYWLDVTTLSKAQPTVFLWYLAPEGVDYETALEQMTNMINQANEASNLVGLHSVQHFLVISHLYKFSGSNNVEQWRQYVMNQQDAAFDIATTRDDVSAGSIFEATDQVLFSGPSAIPWLEEHGFNVFEYGSNSINLIDFSSGDLLDTLDVHPKNPESGAFFATILSEIIRDAGCPTDLVPDGIIEVEDLLSLIAGWGGDGDSDLNDDGTTDVNDLLILIESWGDCWPVQSPYNSPSYR